MEHKLKSGFKIKVLLCLVLFAVFLSVTGVRESYAADAYANTNTNASIKKIENKLNKALSDISALKTQETANQSNYFSNIQLLGTIVASYTYNLAKPDGYNGNYGDNWQSDGFTVNNADITLRRSPGDSSTPYGVGFHVSIDFGQNIQFYKAYYGNKSYFTQPFQDRTPYDVRKAYININLPVGNGLDIHIGKESELLGFEAFNPIRSWNNTYSLLTAVEPATLTGVFLTYNFIPALTSTLGIANTINSVVPVDNLPVIELNESYAALSTLTLNGGFIYGANSYVVVDKTLYRDNVNKSFYSYVDAVYSPTSNWSFVLDYELGLGGGVNRSIYTQNNLTPPTPVQSTYGKSRFNGVAAYIHHERNYAFGQVAETVREVWAHDYNGLWEATSIPGVGNSYTDSTVTFAYLPSFKGFKNIQFRFELEHQAANHNVYLNSKGVPAHSQQNTLNLMVLYSF